MLPSRQPILDHSYVIADRVPANHQMRRQLAFTPGAQALDGGNR